MFERYLNKITQFVDSFDRFDAMERVVCFKKSECAIRQEGSRKNSGEVIAIIMRPAIANKVRFIRYINRRTKMGVLIGIW